MGRDAWRRASSRQLGQEHGFSLFMVLAMLLLSALLVASGARVAHLMEAQAGNQREYQRAFDAAEATLLDAERDIRQLAFDATTQAYVACASVAAAPCRQASLVRSFPNPDTGGVTAYMDAGSVRCKDGICYFPDIGSVIAAKDSAAFRFWTQPEHASGAARYGQFTGAPKRGNPALESARYWIEVIHRQQGLPLYRITAMSGGTRVLAPDAAGGTSVLLQVNIDPDPVKLP